MKKPFSLAMTLAVLSAGFAVAADLPMRKAPPAYIPPPPPPPLWTGFYTGLNAGGGWGVTTNVPTVGVPLFDGVAYGANSLDPANARGGLITGITALANTGFAHVNQSGFIGGGQIGYNWQAGSSFVLGVEADIQGSTIRGSGRYVGASQDSMYFVDPPPSLPDHPLVPCYDGKSNTCDLSRSALGGGQVRAGIDWMGTVRGRLGYLVTPTLLVYGTGGLAYGGVHASATHTATISGSVSGLHDRCFPSENPIPSQGGCETGSLVPFSNYNGNLTFPTFPGASNHSNTRVGWTAGGGLEWMFWPNWSVKAEALYYNLGNVAFSSSPIVAVSPIAVPAGVLATTGVNAGQPLIASFATTRVKYDGVIARAGINYHFNWGSSAPVVAKY